MENVKEFVIKHEREFKVGLAIIGTVTGVAVLKKAFKSKKNEAISKDKLIAQFCLKFNSTERTAKEMLKIFVALDIIKIEGDNITKNGI